MNTVTRPTLMLALLHDLAIATYHTGRLKSAIPLAERARSAPLEAGDTPTAARVLNTLGNIRLALDDVDGTIDVAGRAIVEATGSHEDPHRLVREHRDPRI